MRHDPHLATDSAGAAKRYYATADYYSEGQELVGCLWAVKARTGSPFRDGGQILLRAALRQSPPESPVTADGANPHRGGRSVTTHLLGPEVGSLLYATSGDQAFSTPPGRSERDDAGRGSGDETRVRKHFPRHDRTTGNMVWRNSSTPHRGPSTASPTAVARHVFAFNTTWATTKSAGRLASSAS